MRKRNLLDYVILFLKGLAMGSANKIPGVSGGMIALVTGFYEEFIYSLQKINSKAIKLLINGRFVLFFNYLNAKFLLTIIAGSVFAYFSVSLLLDYLIRQYEVMVWSYFFGMILGSAYYIYKEIAQWNWKAIFFLIFGSIVGVSLSFMEPQSANENLWFVFFCGIVSVSGMTLPGFSGSFILMLMGNYVLLLVDGVNNLFYVITNILSGDSSFLQDPYKVQLIWIIVVFSLGAFVGMVSFSHILGYFLKRFHNTFLALLMGFILGSLGVAWPWKVIHYKINEVGNFIIDHDGNKIVRDYERFIPESWNENVTLALLFACFGIITILIIDYYRRKNGK